MKNKKGQLGLNAVRGFIVAILIIAVLSMAVLVTLNEMSTTSVADGTVGGNVTNYGLTLLNLTDGGPVAITPQYQWRGLSNWSNVNMTNDTLGDLNSANFTYTAGYVWALPATSVSQTLVNFSATFTYKDSGSYDIRSNVTSGVLEFFGNSETFFALLAIAVIILIVGLVILAVNRFGGATTTTSSPSGSSGGTVSRTNVGGTASGGFGI